MHAKDAVRSSTPLGNLLDAYFSHHLRIPLQKIGLIFSGSQFLQVAAILLAPVLFRKFGLVTGIMYTQLATAITLGFLASSSAAFIAGLTYIGYTAFQWMSEPGMYSLLMNQVHLSERSGASAMNALVISSSQAVAALAAGAALARFGYPPVLGAVAVLALIAALLFRLLLHDVSPSTTQPNSLRSLSPASGNCPGQD